MRYETHFTFVTMLPSGVKSAAEITVEALLLPPEPSVGESEWGYSKIHVDIDALPEEIEFFESKRKEIEEAAIEKLFEDFHTLNSIVREP